EKAFEGVRRRRDPAGLECPGHQRRGAVADHAADARFGQRAGAGGDEQGVGRVGEVAPRIDERAVQVKNDELGSRQARYSANEVGVSHTVTRTTGMPCSVAFSYISRAMRSTVGLL